MLRAPGRSHSDRIDVRVSAEAALRCEGEGRFEMRQVPADGVRCFCLVNLFPMCFYVHGECTRLQQIAISTLYPHCIAAVVPFGCGRSKTADE